MLSLPFSIHKSAIDAIKADLTKLLPSVKSSHRVEALARSLGYKTYVSLRNAAQKRASFSGNIIWDHYVSYLQEREFEAPAQPLYIAIGKEALRQLLEKEPFLTMAGISKRPYITRNNRKETQTEFKERFRSDKQDFFEDNNIEQVLRAIAFISDTVKTRDLNRRYNSYGLKHSAERFTSTYPDGTKLGPFYVSPGAFIAATLLSGYSYKEYEEETEEVRISFKPAPQVVPKSAKKEYPYLHRQLSEDKIAKIIELSNTIKKISRSKRSPNDDPVDMATSFDEMIAVLPNLHEAQYNLFKFLETLNTNEIEELTALMLIGRGELATAPTPMRKDHDNTYNEDPENSLDEHIAYLVEKPLHDYLPAALAIVDK